MDIRNPQRYLSTSTLINILRQAQLDPIDRLNLEELIRRIQLLEAALKEALKEVA